METARSVAREKKKECVGDGPLPSRRFVAHLLRTRRECSSRCLKSHAREACEAGAYPRIRPPPRATSPPGVEVKAKPMMQRERLGTEFSVETYRTLTLERGPSRHLRQGLTTIRCIPRSPCGQPSSAPSARERNDEPHPPAALEFAPSSVKHRAIIRRRVLGVPGDERHTSSVLAVDDGLPFIFRTSSGYIGQVVRNASDMTRPNIIPPQKKEDSGVPALSRSRRYCATFMA